MTTLAYFIDPFLEADASFQDQAFLDAIPDIAALLPGFGHIALTTKKGVSLDASADSPLRLSELELPRYSVQGRKPTLIKTLQKWLEANKITLFLTSDPDLVFPHNGKTLLITKGSAIAEKQRRRGLFSGKPGNNWVAANRIVLPLTEDRNSLLSSFPQMADRLEVIYPAFQWPVPALSWSEQEQVKLRYSGGRDYFIYAGTLGDPQVLVNLLKSYSLLKKWLMTGMPVIFAGTATADTPEFEQLLDTYKYRSDVSVFPNIAEEELKEMVAGAYALLWPANGPEQAWPLEWAFHAGTPVISTDLPGIRELCGGAALLSAPGDIDQMAHNLMILYKDETLRARLIEKGRERSISLNRESTLNQYANSIRELCA